ncbi:MAG TPA: ferrous iron transport protein A [Bacillota bacterium]|nr:ferrous iron transport protein A [Bacillota bacterium]
MTLDKTKKGQTVIIKRIPDEHTRIQAIRFGLSEGSVVTCREILPAGPVIVVKNKREIAIGRNLARAISVEPY